MSLADHKIRIELESTGEVWTKIEDFNLRESWFEPSDTWHATVYDYEKNHPRELRRRFQPKTKVRIYFADRLQLIGAVESTEDVSGGSEALTIKGHDYLFPLTKADVDKSIRVLTSMTLEQALLEGLRPYGITKIETSIDAVRTAKMGARARRTGSSQNAAGAAADNLNAIRYGAGISGVLKAFDFEVETSSLVDGEVTEGKVNEGESVYEWAARLVARSGYALQAGTGRDAIAVVRPDYSKAPVYEFTRPGNVEDATCSRSWENVPTYVGMRSRRVTVESDAKAEATSITPVGDAAPFWSIPEARRILEAAGATGKRIPKSQVGNPSQLYVPVYYRDDEARAKEKLDKGARRFLAEQLRDTLNYHARLNGFKYKPTGQTYAINNLATVKDENRDVDETLWIASRSMVYGGGQGERTELDLIRPASYII